MTWKCPSCGHLNIFWCSKCSECGLPPRVFDSSEGSVTPVKRADLDELLEVLENAHHGFEPPVTGGMRGCVCGAPPGMACNKYDCQSPTQTMLG